MAFPAWLARFNKLVTNPILRPVASRAPYFGVVIHRGRISGRTYRTPVNVYERRGEFLFALTYGPDRDWVRNVLHDGAFTLISRGRRADVVEPSVRQTDQMPEAIPPVVRPILRAAGVHTFLAARRAHASSPVLGSDDGTRSGE